MTHMKSKSGRLKEANQSGGRVLKAEALRRKGAQSHGEEEAPSRPAAASIPQARGKRGPRLARRYGKTSSSMLRLSQLSAKTDPPA